MSNDSNINSDEQIIIPEKGFYYHYKHDPNASANNYMYQVLGIAWHTEEELRDRDGYMVLYRPLYKNTYLAPATYSIRPLKMFLESLEHNGKTVPRFTQITDQILIEHLEKVTKEIYGDK